jgi:ParB/RepB/Spo0J family partition protein
MCTPKEESVGKKMNINIDDIEEPRFSVRNYSDILFFELKKSISEHGITIPLTVREENGRYVVLDGVPRYIAAKELGIKELPCRIISSTMQKLLENNMCTTENKMKFIENVKISRVINTAIISIVSLAFAVQFFSKEKDIGSILMLGFLMLHATINNLKD